MVQLRHSLPVAALLAGQSIYAANIQKSGLQLPSSASANRDAVQKIFTDSYTAYKKYAWGHDNLSPVSKSYSDPRNGWGASIIDAMSTMSIMGLTDLFDEAVEFTKGIDFSSSDGTASVFETTIRYLGGFLSAYELSGKKDAILVQKAKEVADKMAFAWKAVRTNSVTLFCSRLEYAALQNQDIPYGYIDFSTNTVQNRGVSLSCVMIPGLFTFF
jgi:mannosyl-oligosaccharide alpha-1,2-mannosidase